MANDVPSGNAGFRLNIKTPPKDGGVLYRYAIDFMGITHLFE